MTKNKTAYNKCKTRHCRRKKNEDIVFEKEQQLSLGEIKEQQKKKGLDLDQQIHFIQEKIKGFQAEFKNLKEQEEITLIELKTIREIVKKNQAEFQKMKTILTLNDAKFYNSYCNNVETKADLGFLLIMVLRRSILLWRRV